jgi:hypothetical protein
MVKPIQRTIEVADFELPRGAIPIRQLLAMPSETWEHLRAEINLRRRLDLERPLARCRLCNGGVFIRVQLRDGKRLPVYAHYPESPAGCPWHTGENLTPDDARSSQYQGHQETAHHKRLCEIVGKLVSADPRCSNVRIDTYLKPSAEVRGRWPDVYFEISDLGKFAVEVQLSKPFALEIAARHLHYQQEGVSLIWVFQELPSDLPQGFRDVITMQRGNAFILDEGAISESYEKRTLILNCYLEADDGKGYLKPKKVGLDDLNLKSRRSVFFDDRRTKRLLSFCRNGREKWWQVFKPMPVEYLDSPFDEDRFISAWASIREFVPEILDWKRKFPPNRYYKPIHHFSELAAILFSIARSADSEADKVYITRYVGKGALVAMLNSKLKNKLFAPYANIIEKMLEGTSIRGRLESESLATSLDQAKAVAEQVSPDHPLWLAVVRLFPEIFDGVIRAELQDLKCLPRWAGGVE